jgi:hypothetical protein
MILDEGAVRCPKKGKFVSVEYCKAHCGEAWFFNCKKKKFWACVYGMRLVDIDRLAEKYGGSEDEEEEEDEV